MFHFKITNILLEVKKITTALVFFSIIICTLNTYLTRSLSPFTIRSSLKDEISQYLPFPVKQIIMGQINLNFKLFEKDLVKLLRDTCISKGGDWSRSMKDS